MRSLAGGLVRAVVSMAIVGCGAGAAQPVPTAAPQAAAPEARSTPDAAPANAATSSAGGSSGSSSSPKKRTRTAAASPRDHDGTKPKNAHPVNPKDNLGRTVFVRADDQCFVEVAPKEKAAPDAPIVRATELVDCPPAANDPAWDHCTAQIVLDETGKCFCISGAGNPRPMPRPIACPK